MKIRKVLISDFEDILRLQLQLEDTEVVFDDNLVIHCYDTEEGRKKLKKRIRSKSNIFFVMEDDNKIVGFIDGNVPDDEWWYKEKVAYINHLCVDSSYRKKDVATKLMSEFEKVAKEIGAKDIRLLAFPNNKPAVSFYKKNGFTEYSIYYNKVIKK